MITVIKIAIKNYIRHRKNLIFNFLFPIFLVLLLGFVLNKSMKSEIEIDTEPLQIRYINEGNEKSQQIIDILKNLKDEDNIELIEEKSIEVGKEAVRLNKAVILYFKDDEIEFYSNSNYAIEASTAYTIISSIINRFNANYEIVKINPQGAMEIINSQNTDNDELFNLDKIETNRTPTAMGYYGVLELGLMVFYFMNIPLHYIEDERKNNIKDRIILSGIPRWKYYIGSLIGYTLACYTSIILSFLILKYIFNANYGENIFIVPIAILPFVILTNTIGLILAIIFKNAEKTDALLSSLIIPILCFLGGAYTAILNASGIFNFITFLSPLRWYGSGVLNSIYLNDYTILNNWLILSSISIIIGIFFIILLANKEEKCIG